MADPVLDALIAEAAADPSTLGLLLHGSRARGEERAGSDYDLIRIVREPVYRELRGRGELLERRPVVGTEVQILYQSSARLRWLSRHPDWYTATYASARVLFDRDGRVSLLRELIVRKAGAAAREQVEQAYDAYLNGIARSLKAARRSDELGRRLHAAESALALIRILFGIEGEWPPYHDELRDRLSRIEAAQGWQPGELGEALLRLTRDADPAFQRSMLARVERLMERRGFRHDEAPTFERLGHVE